MPRAHSKTEYTNLRPIKGTPYEVDWQGDPSTCSHCFKVATHVADKPIASRYSANPDRTRTYRLCDDHAAKVRTRIKQ